MAHAYQSTEDGQIVISDEPRPDLDALARWVEIPVPDTSADPGASLDDTPVTTGAEIIPVPEGAPSEEWSHKQLDAFAADGFTFSDPKLGKADKAAELTTAVEAASGTPAAPVDGDAAGASN